MSSPTGGKDFLQLPDGRRFDIVAPVCHDRRPVKVESRAETGFRPAIEHEGEVPVTDIGLCGRANQELLSKRLDRTLLLDGTIAWVALGQGVRLVAELEQVTGPGGTRLKPTVRAYWVDRMPEVQLDPDPDLAHMPRTDVITPASNWRAETRTSRASNAYR